MTIETTHQALPLSCAETAKLVRAALKRAFPGQQFSVRSSVHSVYATIYVKWTDGPRWHAVDTTTRAYEGSGYGADFVYCARSVSDFEAKRAEAESYIREHCVLDADGRWYRNRQVADIARNMARDYLPGEDWDTTFQRYFYPSDYNADGTPRLA